MSLVPVPCHTRYFAVSPFQHIRGRIAGIQPVAAIFGIDSVQFAGDGQRQSRQRWERQTHSRRSPEVKFRTFCVVAYESSLYAVVFTDSPRIVLEQKGTSRRSNHRSSQKAITCGWSSSDPDSWLQLTQRGAGRYAQALILLGPGGTILTSAKSRRNPSQSPRYTARRFLSCLSLGNSP